MRRIALAIAAALSIGTAHAWELGAMNRTIEQTNMVVDGHCSGTLISLTERLVLTNFHCIEDRISFLDREIVGDDGVVRKVRQRKLADVPIAQHRYNGFERTGTSTYVGEIVADVKQRDLAVVQLKGEIPHTYASPLLSVRGTVTRGERVYIVGNPAAQEATVVEGIVSNVNRTFEWPWTDGAKMPMLQISGGLWGGNSGGALYNDNGELIGVPAAVNTRATFIGFAIPIELVRLTLREACFGSLYDPLFDDALCRADRKRRAEEAAARAR